MIAILNGPNLNLIGKRQPEIYGNTSLDSFLDMMAQDFPETDFLILQSNSEWELIDYLHKLGYPSKEDKEFAGCQGVIINPGALAHYSYALADAIRAIPQPVIEVHISNIFAREEFRRNSVTAPACIGSITGLGLNGYYFAAEALLDEEE